MVRDPLLAEHDDGPWAFFDVCVRHRGPVVDVFVSGELDTATGDRLVEGVAAVRHHEADAIHLDLSSVTFADAHAVACLMRCRRLAVEAGKELAVVRPSRSAALVIDLTATQESLGMVTVV